MLRDKPEKKEKAKHNISYRTDKEKKQEKIILKLLLLVLHNLIN